MEGHGKVWPVATGKSRNNEPFFLSFFLSATPCDSDNNHSSIWQNIVIPGQQTADSQWKGMNKEKCITKERKKKPHRFVLLIINRASYSSWQKTMLFYWINSPFSLYLERCRHESLCVCGVHARRIRIRRSSLYYHHKTDPSHCSPLHSVCTAKWFWMKRNQQEERKKVKTMWSAIAIVVIVSDCCRKAAVTYSTRHNWIFNVGRHNINSIYNNYIDFWIEITIIFRLMNLFASCMNLCCACVSLCTISRFFFSHIRIVCFYCCTFVSLSQHIIHSSRVYQRFGNCCCCCCWFDGCVCILINSAAKQWRTTNSEWNWIKSRTRDDGRV